MESVNRAESEMGGVEHAISSLPGIKGYREKELRRDADKQMRDALVRRLEARRRKLTAMQNDLLSAGGLLWMDDMERVVGRLQLLIDRIKTAAYGYAPLFSMNKVKEDDLERIIAFDQGLFTEVGKIDEATGGLEKAIGANEGIKEALQNLGDLLSGLNETWGRRVDTIQGVTE